MIRFSYRTYVPYALVGLLCFIAGAGVAYAWKSTHPVTPRAVRAGNPSYRYIDPLLLCQSDPNQKFSEFDALKKTLAKITAEAQTKGTINSGSVYFRDLANGQWTGVNENDEYSPASLLKVPVLITYLKAAETNPALLQKKLPYIQQAGQAPPLIEKPILTTGHSYSIKELLRGMIIDSDNTAKDMLEGGMDKTFINEVYSELGIPSPYTGSSNYHISTRTYALFFRILYNATFLNHDSSEQALELLSQVAFDKGLRAGTPTEVPIAHKYGFAILKSDEPRIIELSDCGIVYATERPYLLCVMARGTDPEVTSTYIRDIAAATYRTVVER